MHLEAFAYTGLVKRRYAVYNGDPERYQDRLESPGHSEDDGFATEVWIPTIRLMQSIC